LERNKLYAFKATVVLSLTVAAAKPVF
jgi:hypothetical protein